MLSRQIHNMVITTNVLIYWTGPSKSKYCGVKLENGDIISSALVLADIVCSKEISTKEKQIIKTHLIEYKPIVLENLRRTKYLKAAKFNEIFNGKDNELTRKSVILYSVHNVPAISETISKLFVKFRNVNKPKKGTDHLDDDLFKLLISSFVIFGTRPDEMFKDLSLPSSINKLDEIVSISTPFGFENFFNTINRGIVTNLFGDTRALFTISQTLSVGSEGCGVYNTKSQLIGIVICNSIYYGQDNIDFTMVGNITEIVKSIAEQMTYQIPVDWVSYASYIQQTIIKDCSVSIINQLSSGTGCLVKMNDSKFILTCSHVVNKALDNIVTCHHKNFSFDTKIIYRNPHVGEAYDIALLEVPNSIDDRYFVECDPATPKLGTKIYSVGFPVFTMVLSEAYNPSIYDGYVTKYERGILFTDVPIQAGQSGGPILRDDGYLIGISVQNIKLYDRIYPKSNMVVPICDIFEILKVFSREKDVKILENLIADGDVANSWRLGVPKILNKL